MNKYFAVIVCASVLIFFLAGCGQDDTSVPEVSYLEMVSISYINEAEEDTNLHWPDDTLEEKFAKYWHYRFAGDTDHVWPMEAPHFQFMASPSTYSNYLARSQASLLNIEISDIRQITEYKYHVICLISISRGGSKHDISFSDRWVKVNDDWYHLIRDPLIFPFSAG